MITPAYSLTATERVLPRMALDFTTASLDPRVTVTRSLDTATRINSSGLIETVNANLPRFDYTLNTGGACKGLLIEEARTNVCLYSSDISNPVWGTVYGSFSLTGSQTDPSGGTTATILTGAGGYAQLITGLSVNTTYIYSFYAKAISGTPSYRVVSGGGTNLVARTSYASQINDQTFTRVSFSFTTGAADTSVRVYPMDIGSTTSVVLAFHQVEAGAFATSYIPTTTTSLTRNADAVSMTGTNFSDWYNQTEGAFLIRQSLIGVSGNQSGLTILGTAYNNNAFHYMASYNATRRPYWLGYTGTTNDVSLYLLDAVTLGEQYGVTFAYKENNFAAAKKGETPRTDTSGSVYGSMSQMLIGYGQQYLNGHVQKIMYWPQRITDAEVQAFSK